MPCAKAEGHGSAHSECTCVDNDDKKQSLHFPILQTIYLLIYRIIHSILSYYRKHIRKAFNICDIYNICDILVSVSLTLPYPKCIFKENSQSISHTGGLKLSVCFWEKTRTPYMFSQKQNIILRMNHYFNYKIALASDLSEDEGVFTL